MLEDVFLFRDIFSAGGFVFLLFFEFAILRMIDFLRVLVSLGLQRNAFWLIFLIDLAILVQSSLFPLLETFLLDLSSFFVLEVLLDGCG